MSRHFWPSLAAVVLAAVGPRAQPAAPAYEVYAVRFADVSYSVASLVAGAERGRTIDLAFTIWVVRDPASARVVLVDAGFYRDKFLQQWHPNHCVKPSDALTQGLGIQPDAVTDIIVSHSHWDHADGVDLFPRAKIWIQKEEYEYYVGPNGEVLHRGGADAEDAKMLAALNAAGRVALVDGDDREILPGIRVYTGGKHTFASQFAGVATRAARSCSPRTTRTSTRISNSTSPSRRRSMPRRTSPRRRACSTPPRRPRLVIPGHDPPCSSASRS